MSGRVTIRDAAIAPERISWQAACKSCLLRDPASATSGLRFEGRGGRDAVEVDRHTGSWSRARTGIAQPGPRASLRAAQGDGYGCNCQFCVPGQIQRALSLDDKGCPRKPARPSVQSMAAQPRTPVRLSQSRKSPLVSCYRPALPECYRLQFAGQTDPCQRETAPAVKPALRNVPCPPLTSI